MRLLDELQRMLHAGEVGLGRKGEQIVRAAIGGLQQAVDLGLIDAQLRRGQRRVGDRGTTRHGKLANAIHRIVVVYRQQQVAAGQKRVRLSDVLEGSSRIEGEDRRVVITGVEPVEHRAARALDQMRRVRRGGAG